MCRGAPEGAIDGVLKECRNTRSRLSRAARPVCVILWAVETPMRPTSHAVTYRFGEIEVDVAAYEVRRAGAAFL